MFKKNKIPIQNPFKEDVRFLKNELRNVSFLLQNLSDEIDAIKYNQAKLTQFLNEIKKISSKSTVNTLSTDNSRISTDRHTISTHIPISTDNLTFKDLKRQEKYSSTGNEGVSTDRQTDRQTDKTPIFPLKESVERAAEIIDSLGHLRGEIQSKFKQLTPQEFLVFSTIYQLDQGQSPNNYVDYPLLALKLGITESSIRDHVRRAIIKGAPIEKIKLKNKKITLSIPPNFKKLAPLSTLINLRES